MESEVLVLIGSDGQAEDCARYDICRDLDALAINLASLESEWVDFKAIKASVSMEMALGHYSIQLRRVNQTYLRGKCPLPTHTSKDAQSFGVHSGKNAWACQSDSCTKARGGKRGGNVLDFVAIMENCSVRDAAGRLQN